MANSRARRTFPVPRAGRRPQLEWDRDLVRRLGDALDEDLGLPRPRAGKVSGSRRLARDVTTLSIVPARLRATGRIVAKASGVLCGAPVAERVWRFLSPKIEIDWLVKEGGTVSPGTAVAELEGPYRALLTGERVALNFLQRMSGITTTTRKFVEAVARPSRSSHGAAAPPDICDTRKTTPLWRTLERYAVRVGGGLNHRFGLFDMVLIKENHVRAAGGLPEAIRKAKAGAQGAPIAVEARDLGEVRQACREGVDLILLDNMSPGRVRAAVRQFGRRGVAFEVSGGVTLRNAKAYASTGVDRISIGALTHSAPALDLSCQLFPVSMK